MDIKELRIGNFVNKGMVVSLGYLEGKLACGIIKNKKDKRGDVYSENDLSPLLIKEDSLIKLGFSKIDNKFILNDFIIIKLKSGYKLFGYENIKEFKYIHTLQNIYYSINQKELYNGKK